MNQDALRILAKELTGEQFKVLMLMLADLITKTSFRSPKQILLKL